MSGSRGGAERNIEMRRKHTELFPEEPVFKWFVI